MIKKSQEEIEAQLKDLIATQCSDGNWNYCEYMHGMANGMILALSVINGEAAEFMEAPDIFLAQIKILDKFNDSPIIVGNEDQAKHTTSIK